jgi:transcriptional regulator with XRE-family HTH domain
LYINIKAAISGGSEICMELNDNLKNNLCKLRKDRGVTQDVLAAALDISVQAISKWETGVSLPDIMQLPRIAKFYGVTIDYLFYHEGNDQPIINGNIPDDNKMRIIQFYGNKMLNAELWDRDKTILLKIPDEFRNSYPGLQLNTEIWGNADIRGDVSGYVECGGGLNCGNIGQYVEAGGGINCGNIGQYAECGSGMNCGNIGQNAESGGSINCGNIGGNVECGGSINCGDIAGDAQNGNDISCNNIGGKVTCEGNIRCKEIKGDVNCEGDIIYEK